MTTHVKISEINRTGASPGTFFTVSGTARMIPAEAPTERIGSKESVLGSIKEKMLRFLVTNEIPRMY